MAIKKYSLSETNYIYIFWISFILDFRLYYHIVYRLLLPSLTLPESSVRYALNETHQTNKHKIRASIHSPKISNKSFKFNITTNYRRRKMSPIRNTLVSQLGRMNLDLCLQKKQGAPFYTACVVLQFAQTLHSGKRKAQQEEWSITIATTEITANHSAVLLMTGKEKEKDEEKWSDGDESRSRPTDLFR